MKKIKQILQIEKLEVSPHVKQNLSAAFRAKHQSPTIATIKRGLPLWQVAASWLFLIGAFVWLRPFERQILVQRKPTIEIKEKIITVTDTIFIEKMIEKPVIQYVELPSTTKTTIKKSIETNPPMVHFEREPSLQNNDYNSSIDLETLFDNRYDTAFVGHIERQKRGQSIGETDVPTFQVTVY